MGSESLYGRAVAGVARLVMPGLVGILLSLAPAVAQPKEPTCQTPAVTDRILELERRIVRYRQYLADAEAKLPDLQEQFKSAKDRWDKAEAQGAKTVVGDGWHQDFAPYRAAREDLEAQQTQVKQLQTTLEAYRSELARLKALPPCPEGFTAAPPSVSTPVKCPQCKEFEEEDGKLQQDLKEWEGKLAEAQSANNKDAIDTYQAHIRAVQFQIAKWRSEGAQCEKKCVEPAPAKASKPTGKGTKSKQVKTKGAPKETTKSVIGTPMRTHDAATSSFVGEIAIDVLGRALSRREREHRREEHRRVREHERHERHDRGIDLGIGGFSISDARLKHDVTLLARRADGIGLYRYRYLWSDIEHVGVMAQEVAQIDPAAVMTGPDGYLRVNYARLELRNQTWKEWRAAR